MFITRQKKQPIARTSPNEIINESSTTILLVVMLPPLKHERETSWGYWRDQCRYAYGYGRWLSRYWSFRTVVERGERDIEVVVQKANLRIG
jgi:hypothetical protein